MTYEAFEKIILLTRKEDEKLSKLYDLGLDLINFSDDNQKIIDILWKSHYGEVAEDMLSWWMFEEGKKEIFYTDKKHKDYKKYFDKKRKESVRSFETIKDLWEYMEELRNDPEIFVEYIPKKELTEEERTEIIKQLLSK